MRDRKWKEDKVVLWKTSRFGGKMRRTISKREVGGPARLVRIQPASFRSDLRERRLGRNGCCGASLGGLTSVRSSLAMVGWRAKNVTTKDESSGLPSVAVGSWKATLWPGPNENSSKTGNFSVSLAFPSGELYQRCRVLWIPEVLFS